MALSPREPDGRSVPQPDSVGAARHGAGATEKGRSITSFARGPSLRSGEGAGLLCADLLPDGPVLFVTDATIRGLGLPDAVLDALVASGRKVQTFDAVEAEPSEATAIAASEAALACGASSVVGFGGGSPMDIAKLAAYLAGTGEAIEDIYGTGMARGKRLPLVQIPTTAGTGSEATPIAIVTCEGTQKKGVVADALYADFALLDPSFSIGLPPHVTAATGVDAMVHAIEAFTSAKLKNELSDLFAVKALDLIARNLVTAVRDGGNLAAREAMLLASHLAGVAFANAPVAGVHALAYPLGGTFHLPHGLSNALMLTEVLRFNMPEALDLYAELGPIFDISLTGQGRQAQAQGMLNAVEKICRDCGLPGKLSEVGIGTEHLDALADDAMLQTRLLVNNPRLIDRAAAHAIYSAAL